MNRQFYAMKTRNLFAAALVVCATVSCAKENIQDVLNVKDQHLTTLSITAYCSENSKTVLQDGQNVFWLPSDIIKVFDQNNDCYAFTNSLEAPASSAVFTCSEWPDTSIPQYATSFDPQYSPKNTNGVLTVKVGCKQLVSNASSYASDAKVSVGAVSGEPGAFNISEMKNVEGLLKITFSGSNKIKSLSVQAIGGEPLTGWIDVDYAKLVADDADYWTLTANKEVLPKLTLIPSGDQKAGDGSFVSGEYYLAVIPQTYAKGLRFVMTNTDGQVAVRTVGSTSGVTISRNSIKSFASAVDQGISFTTVQSPDSLKFRLGGDAWNFLEAPVSTDSQDDTNGELYHYDYYDFATGFSGVYDFTICKGTNEGAFYEYNAPDQALEFKKSQAWVRLPAIPGYTLRSLTVEHRNSADRNIGLREGTLSGGVDLVASTALAPGETFSKTFYADDTVKPTENTPSYYRVLSASSFYRNLTFVYAKKLDNKPMPKTITVGFTNAKNATLGTPDAAGNVTVTIAGCDYTLIALNGINLTRASASSVYYLQSGAPGCIQLPAIPKYKLTSATLVYSNAANSSRKVSFRTGTASDSAVIDGGAAAAADKEHPGDYSFTGTEANTTYYMRMQASTIRINQLQLIYSLVEE